MEEGLLIDGDIEHLKMTGTSKEEFEEENTSDEEFIKVEKESIDADEELRPFGDTRLSYTIDDVLEAERRVETLVVQLETLVNELENARTENALLKSNHDSAEEKLKRNEMHCRDLNLDRERMKHAIVSAEDRHKKELLSQREAWETVQVKHRQVCDIKEKLERAIACLLADLSDSKKFCSWLEDKLCQSEQKIVKTDSLLAHALSRNQNLIQKVRSLKELVQESRITHEASRQKNIDLEKFKNENESLANVNLKLSKDLATYASELSELQVALSRAVSEKEVAYVQLQSSVKEKEELITELVSERNDLRLKISSALDENKILGSLCRRTTKELQEELLKLKAREATLILDMEKLKLELSTKDIFLARKIELEEQHVLSDKKSKEEIKDKVSEIFSNDVARVRLREIGPSVVRPTKITKGSVARPRKKKSKIRSMVEASSLILDSSVVHEYLLAFTFVLKVGILAMIIGVMLNSAPFSAVYPETLTSKFIFGVVVASTTVGIVTTICTIVGEAYRR